MRFVQLFEPGADDLRRESVSVSKIDMLTKKTVPMDLLMKGPEEQKVSKEEENTFILQVTLMYKVHICTYVTLCVNLQTTFIT